MSRTLTVLLAGLLLFGCGAAKQVASNPPPSITSPAGGQLAEADDGRTVAMHVGDTVEVTLHAPGGFGSWSAVTSSDRAVLQPMVDTRAAAPLGVTVAKFRAAAAGSAQLTASAAAQCSPGTACPALARVWRVTVQVS